MARSKIMVGVLLALVLLLLIGWYSATNWTQAMGTVRLVLKAETNGKAIVFNEFAYDNPGGPGQFRIQDFRFFVTNIKLKNSKYTFTEPESYHLARFDNPQNSYVIDIPNVPLNGYEKIEFSVGVDTEANGSIKTHGDLDPNSRMAWNWQVGYKFVLFEGTLSLGNETVPLVYHIGFNENRRELTIDLPDQFGKVEVNDVSLTVDVLTLFSGARLVDMSALQTVKFDHDDARMLANNYQNMIQLDDR